MAKQKRLIEKCVSDNSTEDRESTKQQTPETRQSVLKAIAKDTYLNHAEVCKILRIGSSTLFRWIRQGRVRQPVSLLGRSFYSRDWIAQLLREGVQKPATYDYKPSARSENAAARWK